jgi:PadR family transcriptional regulator
MVLSTLERGEAHGLEILHRLEEVGCGLLRLKEGSLYPALYRLEAAGAVKAVWEPEPHGRRGARRRIYRLTPIKGSKRQARRPCSGWLSWVIHRTNSTGKHHSVAIHGSPWHDEAGKYLYRDGRAFLC